MINEENYFQIITQIVDLKNDALFNKVIIIEYYRNRGEFRINFSVRLNSINENSEMSIAYAKQCYIRQRSLFYQSIGCIVYEMR